MDDSVQEHSQSKIDQKDIRDQKDKVEKTLFNIQIYVKISSDRYNKMRLYGNKNNCDKTAIY